MKNLNEKNYNTVLNETYDMFQSRGISIVGDGYKEIATNAALFEHYVDCLTEGANADNAVVMSQLMANTNANILRESSLTGIQPISSLSMPVIRKLWPKFALKEAIENEVAKTPRFSVSYTKPYLFKGDEEKVYLPKGLAGINGDHTAADTLASNALGKEYTAEHTVSLADGAAATVDFRFATEGTEDPKVYLDGNTPSHAKYQPLDELVIVKAYFGGDETKVIKIGKRLGVYGNGIYDFQDADVKGQLIVQFDGKNQRATFAAIGAQVDLVVKAAVSSEYNEESWSVGFDILRQDIDIPSGQHINAPLPVEALNDMMALYQIDGTKETVDLMTNVFAMKLDLEILDFLRDSLANRPSNEAFAGYGAANEFVLTFDCKPAAGFAGSPKAWREELKPQIDYLAQKIKNETYFTGGKFTIIGNPLDVQILANVDWQFRGGNGGNMDGVDVDYSVGTYVGANAYKVVSSVNVPQGAMYLVFTPSSKTQMTYKYYPYAFLTELGYTDPNRSRVPSIMMTQRHTMYEFMPAIGAIVVKNNNGQDYFNQYVAHKEWTEEI